MATKTKEFIKAATISRVSDKATGKFLGFGVKSNHSDQYYKIRCVKSGERVLYSCDCEAKMWGKECSHIKAVKELVEARRQNELDAAAAVAPMVLGSFSQDLQVHLDDELSVQADAIVAEAREDERARKLAAQAMYRDMYPDDYGYYGDVA